MDPFLVRPMDPFMIYTADRGERLVVVIVQIGTYGLAQNALQLRSDSRTFKSDNVRWLCGSTSMHSQLIQLVFV